MKRSTDPPEESASARITRRIGEHADWRGATLQRMRALILAADPAIVEEWKWDVPVWSCAGIICTGEVYTKVVKLTFAHGAAIDDPARLFNASLAGRVRRAIDIRADERVDEAAFTALVRRAVAFNRAKAQEPKKKGKS